MNNETSQNWLYENAEITTDSAILDGYIGFVYEITELHSGMKYIGKKLLRSSKYSIKTIIVKSGLNKGLKKKKKTKIPIWSDWMDYYGSSLELKEAVIKYGRSNYRRDIIKLCTSKSELTYFESRQQFLTDCLLKPKEYYNSWITCRVRRDHLLKGN